MLGSHKVMQVETIDNKDNTFMSTNMVKMLLQLIKDYNLVVVCIDVVGRV